MSDDPIKSIQDYRDNLYAEDDVTRRKADDVAKILGDNTLVAADVLAKAVARLPHSTLAWENAMERFWGDWVRLYSLPDMDEVYRMLAARNVRKPSSDHDFFYIPSDTLKIVAYPSNFNILFIWNNSGFHLRQFWNPWTEMQEDEGEDLADYSDNFGENEYVSRPDLLWYRDNKFVLGYGDCRDVGYIGSYDRLSGRVDKAMSHHVLLKIALGCYVPSLVQKMLGREAGGQWRKITDLGG